MQWLIQDSALNLQSFDNNGYQLAEALSSLGMVFKAVGFIPFVHEVTGLEDTDPNVITMFYGSVQAAALIAKWGTHKPGVYWQDEWWDPRYWIGKRSDLLNNDIQTIKANELWPNWITEPKFAKSLQVKGMTGQVLYPEKYDKDCWITEFSHLYPDETFLLSPVSEPLEAEWRFFVVQGEVITGSIYRKTNIKCRNLPMDPKALDYAKQAVKEWMPNPNIVIDIALTRSNKYKVVEFNSINCSGFYNSDMKKFIEALTSSV
jgi:hypothetical protein